MTGTIYFDIGNVLLNFSREKMIKQIAEVCGLPISEIYNFLFTQKYGNQYELGILSGKALYDILSNRSSKKVSYEALMQAVCDIYEEVEGMLELIKNLKKNNHTLILLSNTCEAHFNYIEKRYPVFKHFDNKVLSYKVGIRKPDPEIFLQSLSMSKNALNFYTDDLEENVMSAKTVGLDAVVFKDTDQIIDELAKRSFLP